MDAMAFGYMIQAPQNLLTRDQVVSDGGEAFPCEVTDGTEHPEPPTIG